MKNYILLSAFIITGVTSFAQKPIGEWWHWPKYTLGQRASRYPGPRLDAPTTPVKTLRHESTPILFHGEEPTNRIVDFISG